MQAAISGLDWDQYGGMLVGGLLAVLLPTAVLLWDRRQRRLRKERPPLPNKLLRPPGYSLGLKVDELWERITTQLMIGYAAGTILGIITPSAVSLFYHWLVGHFTFSELVRSGAGGLFMAVILLIFGLVLTLTRQVLVVLRDFRQLRNYQFGLRGEQAVGEALNAPDVIRAGYRTFHDVPGDGKWNIDHVVVGPGGVFVIETKTRAKRRSTNHLPDHEVEFDGQALQFPWGYDREAVNQVQRNAEWVRKFLAGFGPKDVPVQPVMVVPGWYVRPKGNYPVKVMNEKYLSESYLRPLPRRLDTDQLTPIIRRLDERCRTLEF